MSCQAQEDVVERRSAKGDVVDADLGLVEVADDLDEAGSAAMSRHGQSSCVFIDVRPLSTARSECLDGTRDCLPTVDDDLDFSDYDPPGTD